MIISWKKLLINLVIPLAVGGLSALSTMGSMESFEQLNKPPLSPPGWLFPIVWTILFILMGISAYLVSVSGKPTDVAFKYYGLQLVFNFLWSIIFFNFENYLLAFVWLIALLVLIVITAVRFYSIDKRAGYLFIPYILWVVFAGYLNLGIYILNR